MGRRTEFLLEGQPRTGLKRLPTAIEPVKKARFPPDPPRPPGSACWRRTPPSLPAIFSGRPARGPPAAIQKKPALRSFPRDAPDGSRKNAASGPARATSLSETGSCNSGRVVRPHCFTASATTRRQRSMGALLCRPPWQRSMITGRMAAVPSSTAWRSMASMRRLSCRIAGMRVSARLVSGAVAIRRQWPIPQPSVPSASLPIQAPPCPSVTSTAAVSPVPESARGGGLPGMGGTTIHACPDRHPAPGLAASVPAGE